MEGMERRREDREDLTPRKISEALVARDGRQLGET